MFFAKARLRTRLEAEARAKVWDEIRADTQARAERDLIEAQARADARAKARAEEEARIKAAAEARAKARVSAEQAWRAKVSSEQAERAKMLAKTRAEAAVPQRSPQNRPMVVTPKPANENAFRTSHSMTSPRVV